MSIMEEKCYPYNVKPGLTLVVISILGIGAFISANEAWHNDQGLVINHIIHLSPKGATIFYWAMTALMIPLLFGFILGLVRGLSQNLQVVLTNQSIKAPKNGFSRKYVTIPYKEVIDLNVMQYEVWKKAWSVLVIESNNQKIHISSMMLPGKLEFESLINELRNRIPLTKNS